MATWQARAVLRRNGVQAPADVAAAQAAVEVMLAALVPDWTVQRVEVTPELALGDVVVARKQAGEVEYARVVQGATELQVAFADGTRRGLGAVVERV